jgi:cytochrome c peroxidase
MLLVSFLSVVLGRSIFFDARLSEPPGTSCASCHDPAAGFAGSNGSERGVAAGSRPGHYARRNTPSLLYLAFVPRFHFKWEEDAPLPDAYAGLFWDGRADTLAAGVQQPLLNPDEMNNPSPESVVAKVRSGAYSEEFAREYGASGGMNEVGQALADFLTSPEMAPFSSPYDDYVRGVAPLPDAAARGLAAFKDPARGACDGCHKLDDRSGDPQRSPFTDYGFEVLGVPRNPRLGLAAGVYDLGLCERVHEDRFCGAFKTPSLRNVAKRPAFMHNGVFTTLRDAVKFYADRKADTVSDDLPEAYRAGVNDDFAHLSEQDVDDLVAFLTALNDRD